MYIHILVATDGSARAERAVEAAMGLGAGMGARLTFLTVIEPGPDDDRSRPGQLRPLPYSVRELRAEWVLAEAEAKALSVGFRTDAALVTSASPSAAILAEAERRRCDLIVVGARGQSSWSAETMGSQAARIVTESKIPVMVAR